MKVFSLPLFFVSFMHMAVEKPIRPGISNRFLTARPIIR